MGNWQNFSLNSATQQNHWTPSSLKDIDKGLTHIIKLLLQEADPFQMKTADHKMIDLNGEALYSQQKQDWELTVAQIMNSLLPNSDLNWRK